MEGIYFILVLIVFLLLVILHKLKHHRPHKPPGAGSFHLSMFINLSLKTIKKGDIMEGNVKVDQRGLLVFDGPKDKYENPTTLNGPAAFSSSDETIATIALATQDQIDEFNNDPATQEADKIPAANFPYTGAFKSNGKVGAALLKITGDPTTADDDTPIESSFTLNVGAGAASSFGTVKLAGVKDDEDAD